MGIKRRMQWTVFSDDIRAYYIRPLLKHGSQSLGRVARLFRVEEDKIRRISNGDVTRTQAIKGSASKVFEKTFPRTLPNFHIIRIAVLIMDQLRNMRADNAVREDYIVTTIELGMSHYAVHHRSVTGLAAAVLESMRAVLTFTAAIYKWGCEDSDEKAREMRKAKVIIEEAIEMYRHLTSEEDRHYAKIFLARDYQNLMFVGSEIDELDNPTIEFDDERNPKTMTRAIMNQLSKSGAIEELRKYVMECRSLRGSFNLANYHGVTNKELAAEEDLLLCLRIQRPTWPEDLQVPEMRKGPHEIPYLKESYERAWKRYLKEMKREEAEKARKRKEAERQRKGTKREEGRNRTKVAALVYAVVVPMMGAAIGLLAFVTEVLATKPVPG
jgi:hypothetical protein